MRFCGKIHCRFRWKENVKPRDPFRHITEEGYGTHLNAGSNRGPMFFKPQVPEPLREIELSQVELTDGQWVSENDVREQALCATLDPNRMGLPEPLVQKLASRGVRTLTPIQARILQSAYARENFALCAATGTGKTLALCVALVARFMREGPPTTGSTLVLVPTCLLAEQVKEWITALWWYPLSEDPQLVRIFRHSSDVTRYVEDLAGPNRREAYARDPLPYITITTPQVMWSGLEMFTSMNTGTITHSLWPWYDTLVMDEADEIFPLRGTVPDSTSPGSRLFQWLYIPEPAEPAPHLMLTSATLTPCVISHMRRCTKKNIFNTFGEQSVPLEYSGTSHAGTPRSNLRCHSPPQDIEFTFRMLSPQSSMQESLATVKAYVQKERVSGSVLVLVPTNSIVTDLMNQELSWSDLPSARLSDIRKQSDAITTSRKGNVYVSTPSQIRGIDIPFLAAMHVICIPSSVREFVHWSGRVGRLGRKGSCSFYVRPENCRIMQDFASLCNLEVSWVPS